MKTFFKIAGVTSGLGLILFFSLFTFVDRTPYTETAYYQQTIQRLNTFDDSFIISGDTIRAGWSKINITPQKRLPLAGYGKRGGKLFEDVHDSLWVRTVVFTNEETEIALVTADLLIIPNEVTIMLEKSMKEGGLSSNQIFLSATHTHCSIGGWAPGITGEFFAGEFDPYVVEYISQAIIESIIEARKNQLPVKIGFARFQLPELVANRLVGEQGKIDPWLRLILLEQINGKVAAFTTFAAHPTCLSSSYLNVSRGYPGQLVDQIEALDKIDFALFAAGAVGSQKPGIKNQDPWIRINTMVGSITEQIELGLNFMPTQHHNNLGLFKLPLGLRDPHFRISEDLRIRPGLFRTFFGDYPSEITVMRLGHILLVGMPCDFSGELMEPLQELAVQKGLNLIITSFNGGYIGYITDDQWYDLDKYETRTMNWFGPYNGAYFSELIARIIEMN